MMGSSSTGLLQFLTVVFILRIPSANANTIHCPIFGDIREFEKYFGTLKEMLHGEDKITDVTLLKTNELKEIHSPERCCFLRKLGHFYISKVFPEVDSPSIKQNRDFTHLANSILGLNNSLRDCHRCHCGNKSHMTMKKIEDKYFKMERKAAAIKAVGELNILFHWMEHNYLS